MDTATVLTTVMKGVADALRLDGCGNKPKEAYAKYLECTLRIVTKLMQDVRKDGGLVCVTMDTVKFVRLAQQCMERISAIINTLAKTVSSPNTLNLQGRQNREKTNQPESKSAPVTPLGPSVTLDKDHINTNARLSSSSSLPFPGLTHSYTRQKSLSPMEIAYRKNQQLMDAYKTRLGNLSKGTAGFNLRLTIQRKMAENLAIAKIHEEALEKKMKERQKRLEEQASRKFSDSIGQSKEEEEKRQLYRNVLEYEQDTEWFSEQRRKLEENPTDSKLMQQLIIGILRCSDHPLTEKLKTFQFKIYEKIYPLVKNKMEHIKQIRVPLPENLYPPGMTSESSDEDEESDEDSDENLSETDNIQIDETEVFRIDDEHSELSKIDEDSDDAICDSMVSNMEISQMKIKGDLEKGLVKGDVLKEKLKREQKQAKRIVRQVTQDYEQYSIDNMDDLFEDDDDDYDDVDDDEKGNQDMANKWQHSTQNSSSHNSDQSDVVIPNKDIPDISDVKSKTTEENLNNESDTDIPESSNHKTENISTGEISVTEILDDDQTRVDQTEVDQLGDDQTQHDQTGVDQTEDDQTLADQLGDDETEADKTGVDQIVPDQTGADQTKVDQTRVDQTGASQAGEEQSRSGINRRPSSSSNLRCRKPVVENVRAMADRLEELKNEAYHRHIKGISTDVQISFEKLQTLFIVAYEQLDTPQGRDQCYACLEKPFFQPLWQFLFALFRLANEPRETAVAYVMTRGQDSLPKDYKVAKRLRLETSDPESYPYRPAVCELQTLTQQYTLLDKLECLVKCSRLICHCVEDYYAKQENTDHTRCPSIGADDLLPILCYVIVKTGQPQIVSECHIMEEFIHEGYIMGEEGYCLTSLQTALAYLTSLGMKTS